MLNKLQLNSWGSLRIIRLVFGILGFVAFYMSSDPIYLMLGSVLSIQAITNFSCGPGGCGIPVTNTKNSTQTKEITYEEIK